VSRKVSVVSAVEDEARIGLWVSEHVHMGLAGVLLEGSAALGVVGI